MIPSPAQDAWKAGQSYERYMGRWSRQIADKFLEWLAAPKNVDWVDIGSGTGALTGKIIEQSAPKSVVGIEPSEGFIAHARQAITDRRARFVAGGAESLPIDDRSVDVATSALVLNFVPDRAAALREMQRVTRPGGMVSLYVWDYPNGGMEFIDRFWKAAARLDPRAKELDEATRFPFCTAEGVKHLCGEAGFDDAKVTPIEIETRFSSFDDFWQPFLLGTGPAPAYCKSLPEEKREALRQSLLQELSDGEIRLGARAWAMKAQR